MIETERLLLRPHTLDDYEALCEILQDPQAMYAYEHALPDWEAREWLERQIARQEKFGYSPWAVILKESGRLIGQCGLSWQETDREDELEIGYLLNRVYWHKGYAAEAAIACRDYAFDVLGQERVCSIIRDNNLSSQAVARRMGMKPERTFVKHYYGMEMPPIIFTVHRNER